MTRLHWLIAAIALQIGVLATEYLGSVWHVERDHEELMSAWAYDYDDEM